jgi:hypothetical protein
MGDAPSAAYGTKMTEKPKLYNVVEEARRRELG